MLIVMLQDNLVLSLHPAVLDSPLNIQDQEANVSVRQALLPSCNETHLFRTELILSLLYIIILYTQ